MLKIKEIIRSILPPIILKTINSFRLRPEYTGRYSNFSVAREKSTGYDSVEIFEKIKKARESVLRGEATYERDGITFKKSEYFWPLLSCLLYIASKNQNKLNLLDFGGSLGTTYFQNLPLLNGLSNLNWTIVEQKRFVDYGVKNLQTDRLKFYENYQNALDSEKPDAVLFSSSLQYLENPEEIIKDLHQSGIKYFIFDRTPFMSGNKNRVAVQNISDRFFKGSKFPVWIFGKEKFKSWFVENYNIVSEFESIGNPITTDTGHEEYLGMLLEKKND